jgi:hypothetical protein
MTTEATSKTGILLPGQATEQAAAEVGSEAGKSLIRGLARLGAATVEQWVTTKQARAEAARLAIETDARLATEGATAEARRKAELAEIEHRAVLQRRLHRLEYELRREQANLEAIEAGALSSSKATLKMRTHGKSETIGFFALLISHRGFQTRRLKLCGPVYSHRRLFVVNPNCLPRHYRRSA